MCDSLTCNSVCVCMNECGVICADGEPLNGGSSASSNYEDDANKRPRHCLLSCKHNNERKIVLLYYSCLKRRLRNSPSFVCVCSEVKLSRQERKQLRRKSGKEEKVRQKERGPQDQQKERVPQGQWNAEKQVAIALMHNARMAERMHGLKVQFLVSIAFIIQLFNK